MSEMVNANYPYKMKREWITLHNFASRKPCYEKRQNYDRQEWPKAKQYAFIDSLLRGTAVSPIVLLETSKPLPIEFETCRNSQRVYSILDGFQRIESIFLLLEGRYLNIPVSLENVSEFREHIKVCGNETEKRGCAFDSLSENLKQRIKTTKYPVITISTDPKLTDTQRDIHVTLLLELLDGLQNHTSIQSHSIYR